MAFSLLVWAIIPKTFLKQCYGFPVLASMNKILSGIFLAYSITDCF